jgi:arylsulfatase A-like enzyme
MDDMGLHDLGCTGSTFYETPNIDALARRGCMFPVSYAACPVCSPTRAAIMTGKYPPRVKVTDYIGGPQPAKAARLPNYKDRLLPAPYQNHLALEETTIAEAMKDAGYATFFAGKWHLGGEPYYPEKQGFDVNIGGGHQGSPGKGGYFSPYTVPLSPGPKGEHLDLRLARETTKWISQQSADKPFFAYFALYDVHIPLMAPQETIEYFQAKRDRLHLDDQFTQDGKSKERLNQSLPVYAAMVKTSDDAIGMVIDQLKQQNLLDKTIIIFTSDNGGLSTAQGWPTSNEPQRAGKGWAYEGGVREPLIIDAPGVTRPGSSSEQRTISMDCIRRSWTCADFRCARNSTWMESAWCRRFGGRNCPIEHSSGTTPTTATRAAARIRRSSTGIGSSLSSTTRGRASSYTTSPAIQAKSTTSPTIIRKRSKRCGRSWTSGKRKSAPSTPSRGREICGRNQGSKSHRRAA